MSASAVVTSEQAAGFLEAALACYGRAVLTSAAGEGGEAAAELGRRLIWEVFGGQDSAGSLLAALSEPVARQEDDDAFSRLFNWVADLLEAEPELETAAVQMLARYYRDQFEAGHAAAMADLGHLLLAQGRRQEGWAAYRQAANAGHLQALIHLAELQYGDRPDPEGAQAACQEAIDSADPDVSAEAQVLLGSLLNKAHHQYAAATEAYRRAIDTGRPHWALAGMRGLADVLEQQGDVEGARAVYQQMIDFGHAEWSAQALVSLGELLESRADAAGAKAAYWRVLDSPAASWAAYGLVNLVNMLQQEDDLDGARAAYRKARETGNRDAPRASVVIGQLLENMGDTAGARAAYQQAIDTGHPYPEDLLDDVRRLGEPR